MESFFDMLHMAATNVWTYGVTFLVVLGVLVFVHEWGHYIVARLCGVRVEVFSVGFGREIFGWTAKSGTRWKISLFPLGGYVKMFGDADPTSAGHTEVVEDDAGHTHIMTAAEREVAFFAKPVWKRAAIVFAGPAINFLFAVVILTVLYASLGRPVVPPQISGVEVGGAADKGNFMPRDVIKTVNGTPIDSFREVRRTIILTLDEPIKFEIERDGKLIELTGTPKRMKDVDRFGFTSEYGYMGFFGPADGLDIKTIVAVNGTRVDGNVDKARELLLKSLGQVTLITTSGKEKDGSPKEFEMKVQPPADLNKHLTDSKSKDYNVLMLGVKSENNIVQYGPIESIGVAVHETYEMTADTLKAIGEIFVGTRSTRELGGIIRIGAMAGTMAEQGWIALFVFTAGLSINLGLINLFPIPMLDGGHLLFYGMEAVRGKPISERVQEYAFRFGLVILVSLMVFSNLNDILQVFVFKGAGS